MTSLLTVSRCPEWQPDRVATYSSGVSGAASQRMQRKGSKSILRKRGLEVMLEEMSDLYDLECKKLK